MVRKSSGTGPSSGVTKIVDNLSGVAELWGAVHITHQKVKVKDNDVLSVGRMWGCDKGEPRDVLQIDPDKHVRSGEVDLRK